MFTAHTRQCLRRFMNIQQIHYLYSAYLACVTVGLPTGWPTDWETGCTVYTYTFNRLSNRLCRVNTPPIGCPTGWATGCIVYTQLNDTNEQIRSDAPATMRFPHPAAPKLTGVWSRHGRLARKARDVMDGPVDEPRHARVRRKQTVHFPFRHRRIGRPRVR